LWDADRGSTAKGVVSIKNKDYNLIAGFIIVSMSEFGVSPLKFRARVTVGYGRAIDIYYTSMRVRRILEEIVRSKEELTGINAIAFIAGKIDGDGYVDPVKREIIIGYSGKN